MDEGKSKLDFADQIIKELYEEFHKEQISLKHQYDNNSAKIDELEESILCYIKNEDIDFKVFSPRSIVSTNSTKIDNLRNEKDNLENENKTLFKQLSYYSDRAIKLEKVMDVFNSEEKEVKHNSCTLHVDNSINIINDEIDNQSEIKSNLDKINHRINQCYHFCDTDINRTKVELKAISSLLNEFISKLYL